VVRRGEQLGLTKPARLGGAMTSRSAPAAA
jgi:hypothetical protein